MKPSRIAAGIAVAILGLWFVQRAYALATEVKGNEPLSELNYAWKGIMPVVNDPARVYQIWCNGNENLYYKGNTRDLNAALAHFAKSQQKNHFVVLRNGPAVKRSFGENEIPYNWELHILSGIAAHGLASDKTDDLDRYREPVLTVFIGGDIDLDKIVVPEGVTLRTAAKPAREAKGEDREEERIAKFIGLNAGRRSLSR
jgi:hypothetical protein